MAHIAPFRGVRYAADRVGSLDRVVAPPYDVISPEERAALVARSPQNIVQVDLPTDDGDTRYERAGRLWRAWLADGIVRPDDEPALYFLEERFTLPSGRAAVRHGLVTALALESFGASTVAPHEQTFAGPKADRLKLMRATRANLSQVLMLCRDAARRLDAAWEAVLRRPAGAETSAPDGNRRMWTVTDADVISLARDVLAGSALTIADGHHRYETALTYREECRARAGDGGAAEALMVYVSRMDDPDLVILASHRIVSVTAALDFAAFRRLLGEHFDLTPVPGAAPAQWLARHLVRRPDEPYRFGFFARPWGWLLATLRSWEASAPWIGPARSEPWRRLDVSVLHELVLGHLAHGAAGGADAIRQITYTIDPAEGQAAVERSAADLVCMVPPTTSRQIADIVQAGDTMPHKSTYFYPKLLTGLVMRSLDEPS